MTIAEKVITHAEFWELIEQHPEKRLELIDGEIVEMPSPSGLHGVIAGWILTFINLYLLNHRIGFAVGESYHFELAPGLILAPDAAFISYAKSATIPDKFTFAPDLAVEVMSPSNTDMIQKVETFLRYGTQAVWVIYPDEKVVRVYQRTDDDSIRFKTLSTQDILEGGQILPDFQVKVRELFPA